MAVTNYYTVNGKIRGEGTAAGGYRPYGHDALGSVVATYDITGSLQNTYRNAPYGTQVAKTGTAADPRFLYNGGSGYRTTGRSYSPFYVRNRHLDNKSAQWTTLDSLWPSQAAYGYVRGRAASAADPSGLLTIAGDTEEFGPLMWIAPGNWFAINGPSKTEAMRLIEQTNDDAVGIFGHGKYGCIYINATECLDYKDLDTIAKVRASLGKKKFNYFMVNECSVFSDKRILHSALKLAWSVQGYNSMCYGISGLRKMWGVDVVPPSFHVQNAPPVCLRGTDRGNVLLPGRDPRLWSVSGSPIEI